MAKLVGKIDGLSRRQCNDLQALSDFLTTRGELVGRQLAENMLALSLEIKREVACFIDRNGQVLLVSVGALNQAPVFELKKKRWQAGYAGVRCVHTHPSGTAKLSDADLSALESLHFDEMVALAQKEDDIHVAVAMLAPVDHALTNPKVLLAEELSWQSFEAMPIHNQLLSFEAELVRQKTVTTDHEKERALLVMQPDARKMNEAAIAEEELKELADTAGLEVVCVVSQALKGNQHKIGSGKLDEIALMVQNEDCDVVVFDQALTPSYNQMLSDRLGVKVIDKTVLILDIFAQRARSKEGKLQVELAQLNYLLPRLTGMGTALSRLGGGVGTRGPGETQLETDRRHIRRRIHHIHQELENVKTSRELQRNARLKRRGLQVALVGYTNAGKSTLLNKLVDDNIYAADQLFATLDPTTRRLTLDSGEELLISDTVGFIRDLPTQLIEAFKATLEELHYADVLLHVVDVSKDGVDESVKVVEDILMSLGLEHKKHILVCNKIDACDELPIFAAALAYQHKCFISCKTGEGIDALLALLKNEASGTDVTFTLTLPFDQYQGQRLALAHEHGQVLEENYTENGAQLKLKMPKAEASKFFYEYLPAEYKDEVKW